MNIKSSGVFGDQRSGGGLFRGFDDTSVSGRVIVTPVAPGHVISCREVTGYYFDFFDETNELDLTNQWEDIDVGTMTLNPSVFIIQGQSNGILRLDSDATDGDGNWLSITEDNSLGYGFVPAAGRTIVAEAYIAHADWDAHHWFYGLIEDVGGSAGMDASGDMLAAKEYVGFHHNDDDDADGIPRLILAGANNTEVTTSPTNRQGVSVSIATGTDDAYRRFGIRIEGTDSIEWWLDGVCVGQATAASAFTAALYTGFGSVMNTGSGDEFDIDYCLAFANRT